LSPRRRVLLWGLPFAVVGSVVAYQGLRSYRFIGVAWLMHSGWDLVHHFFGHTIWPFIETSSFGCRIFDAVAPTPRRGIWRLKTDGYFVTVRVTDPRTGKRYHHAQAVRGANVTIWERDSRPGPASVRRARPRGGNDPSPLWSDYAVSLLEAKVA
jgi:hypothetical protein